MLENPSQLLSAIKTNLQQALTEQDVVVQLQGVSLNPESNQPAILIEFKQSTLLAHSHDGRYSHLYNVVLHILVNEQLSNAQLQALDLAAKLQQLIVFNCWGLPRQQIDFPLDINGSTQNVMGYQSWDVSFNQRIHLGKSLLVDPPVLELYASSHNFDDINSYERVNPKSDSP